jgi:hypothetical protein
VLKTKLLKDRNKVGKECAALNLYLLGRVGNFEHETKLH